MECILATHTHILDVEDWVTVPWLCLSLNIVFFSHPKFAHKDSQLRINTPTLAHLYSSLDKGTRASMVYITPPYTYIYWNRGHCAITQAVIKHWLCARAAVVMQISERWLCLSFTANRTALCLSGSADIKHKSSVSCLSIECFILKPLSFLHI